MIRQRRISLHRLILSLSEALDHVSPEISDHQLRVAYIALAMAHRMGFSRTDTMDLFVAAALHDIGLIRIENRLRFLQKGDFESVSWHGKTGYELLRHHDLFAEAARIIRYHHTPWAEGDGSNRHGRIVPLGSHIIHLADWVERSLDRKRHILEQSKGLRKKVDRNSGSLFPPTCVDAFHSVAQREAFWLDCVSPHLPHLLMQSTDDILVEGSDITLQHIALVFARVVDAMSRWTVAHTAGVVATSLLLARKMRLSRKEQISMRIAALLHDLGKLSVPSRILDKPGNLTASEWAVVKGHTYHTFRILESGGFPQEIIEWAAFHHERLDGGGYPFRHEGRDLTLGARIMAVADIFTAMAEDRPYRKGMSEKSTKAALNRMAKFGALDPDLVQVLIRHYEEHDSHRRQEQARYTQHQNLLTELMEPEMVLK